MRRLRLFGFGTFVPAVRASGRPSSFVLRVFILLLLFGLTANCGGPEEKKMKFFNKGKALYEKGDYVRAELEFKNSVQIDPKFADGHYMLGMTALRRGNIRGAHGSLSKTLELSPDHVDAQAHLGRLLLRTGKLDEAMEKAEAGLKVQRAHPEALLLKRP